MKKLRFLVASAIFFILQSTHAILGGEPVFVNNPVAPFIARLVRENSKTFCSGVFLHPRIVLTAAHCEEVFNADAVSIVQSMYVGGNSYSQSGSKTLIQKFIKHEDYRVNQDFDVAIVLLAEPRLQMAVPIKLWPYPTDDLLNTTLTSYGYGRTNPGEDLSQPGILRNIEKNINKVERTLLLYDQTDRKGICYGDSGGPAIIQKDNTFYVVGIHYQVNATSRGQQTTNCYSTGKLVKIETVKKWIDATMASLLKQM
ncbi:MAG: trypsin-like serine protease [Bdellovibrionaceae bacterium]|nr:trypsin-like serine protease [Bdellovibrio sp.]